MSRRKKSSQSSIAITLADGLAVFFRKRHENSFLWCSGNGISSSLSKPVFSQTHCQVFLLLTLHSRLISTLKFSTPVKYHLQILIAVTFIIFIVTNHFRHADSVRNVLRTIIYTRDISHVLVKRKKGRKDINIDLRRLSLGKQFTVIRSSCHLPLQREYF